MDDSFETELGWSDVGANTDPVDQSQLAYQQQAQQQQQSQQQKPAPEPGMSEISRITMHSMRNEEEPAPAPAPDPKPQPTRQVPQPVYQDPSTIAKVTAEATVQAILQANQLAQQQQKQPSAYQAHLKTMLESGAEEKAVATLDQLVSLKLQEQQQLIAEQAQQTAHQQYQQHVGGIFADAFETVLEAVPQLSPFAASLHQKAQEIWQSDPQFQEHYQKMLRGQAPSRRVANAVMSKASDTLSAAAGIAKPQPSVSIQSSKPSRTTGNTNTAGGVHGLDMAQRRYYDALKGQLGHQRALESARKVRSG